MSEQPENIRNKPWRKPAWILAFFGLVAAATFIVILSFDDTGIGNALVNTSPLMALIIAVCLVAGVSLLLLFVRWLCSWRNFKRFLFGVACLLTLIALAYVVENTRGHYAWKKFERAAAAKGERMDLPSIIPPPVPDAENFAMAPIFQGLRNWMDRDYVRTHTGPGGFTNVNRFCFTAYRTNRNTGTLRLGNWLKAERTDLIPWQRYYRDPDWDGVVERTNATPASVGTPTIGPNSTKPAHATNEFATTPQPQSPAADVLLALSKYDAALEELREAARRPQSRFPLHYEDTFEMLLPHVAHMKAASQFLAVRAVAELDSGQSEQALADVRLSIRLVESTKGQGILISHLVRVASTSLTLQPVWEGLADHRWNDAQLATLDADLGRMDFLSDYLTAMRGERASVLEAVDYLRRTRDRRFLFGWFSGENGPSASTRALQTALMHLIPSGWFDQNKVRMGRLHLLFLAPVNQAGRVVSPTKDRQSDEVFQQALIPVRPYNIFATMLLPAASRLSERCAQGQASVDLARVACALERYRLAHGGYPEKLDALAPQFIAQLPHDVINGQPLKYRRTDDGQFVLYSVGWNEIDDGGQVGLTAKGDHDWRKGDWVWRYPAK
jgi:hypothetical protein